MTARDLKLAGMTYLAYTLNHPAVCAERHFRGGLGDPDIISVSKARCVTEIEIKVTMSDFRANSHKRHIISRSWNVARWPKFYYFLVPPAMVDDVLMEMHTWAGLLTVDEKMQIKVISRAPENSFAKRATMKECAKLVRCLTNQAIADQKKFLRVCKLLAVQREADKK